MTLIAAGFVMLLTSAPADELTADEVLQTYRLRWQVELAFKRLKSGMGIHKLPARDERLARSWLTAHLILALMIDDASPTFSTLPPVKTKPRTAQSLSLWRLHSLLRSEILNAILMVMRPGKILTRVTEIIRHVCDHQDGAKTNPPQQG
ncbi:transposase [Mesorhizobium sp. M0494]|uniref:transposase n=1 Tax=Mesorhizobium sp. M0494 TaxID=2956951 RepID=UPI00333BBC73